VAEAVDEMMDLRVAPNISDCGKHAVLMHAKILEQRIREFSVGGLSQAESYQWPVGECIGYRNGLLGEEEHAFNFCVSEKGVLFIEPRNGQVWRPERNERGLFFVKI
jgi:hypothetical protein